MNEASSGTGPSGVSRREFLQVAGASLSAPFLLSRNQPSESAPPNVIMLLPDQWRRMAMGIYGNAQVQTPNIDRLGREGVTFERCYATDPLCTPDRAALLTGRYPHQTGIIKNNLRLPKEEATLADILSTQGYRTGFIGKWHLDGPPKPGFVPPGRRQGFDYFKGFNRGHRYYDPIYFTEEGTRVEPDAFEPTVQTDLATEYIRDRASGDRPFFLTVFYGPPHQPYQPPEAFDRFDPDALHWRPNVPEEMREDPEVAQALAGYYGLCEAIDHEVGRILQTLDEQQLSKNTLVLLLSDHGDMHGSHGLMYKGHPHEESTGIPLLARWPAKIPANVRTQTVTAMVDILPSVLSLLDVSSPKNLGGRDRSRAFLGEDFPESQVYLEGRVNSPRTNILGGAQYSRARYGAWRAIVNEQYKLAVDSELRPRLFVDLLEDPYELNNMAGQQKHQELEQNLMETLREMSRQTGDSFPAVPERRGVVESRKSPSDG